ncbi:MAG: hypothetical protein DMG06_04505 [Acidobacteria bacterium]|nr:MAG: hypothetical protein DMG06_04505 [Acidobacteriota bacterium]
MGDYHNFAEYNPVYKVVVFGGGNGSRKLYKMSSNGMITALQDAPVDVGVQSSLFTVDPASGDYLVFSNTNSSFWVYKVQTDTWIQQAGTPPIFQPPVNETPVHGLVASPISTYGVDLFVDCQTQSSCVVRLYKHAGGGAVTPPPLVPPSGTLQVGPGKQYPTISAAVAAAQTGNIIEIGAGVYPNETLTISKSNLTLRGVGGYAHLKWGTGNYQTNTSLIANGKGIFVISGSNITLENLEFSGAKVVDENGAGIRYEGGDLTVRGSYFHDNENGILGQGGAGNTLLIEHSIFERNGYCPTSCAHNLYIGNMGRLIFRHNKSIDSREGHPLKSRALVNEIISNYLSTKNSDGSYEADFPNGGTLYFVGNIVEQGAGTGNPTMLSYGEEGASNPNPALYVINNTFYNWLGSGTFVAVSGSPTLTLKNNIFSGGGTTLSGGSTDLSSNKTLASTSFVSASSGNFHLIAGSSAIDAGIDPGSAATFSLTPQWEYVEPAGKQARVISGGGLDVGAYEFVSGTPIPSDTIPPIVSGMSAASITSSSATITWTTNEPADSQVDYALTSSYTSSSPLNTSLITSHSVNIAGLAAFTLYHYRIKSKDAAGNLTTSADFMFTTLGSGSPPPGSVAGYHMPSVQDEKNTYTSWGWTWKANQEPSAVTDPISNYTVNDPDIHYDTEGDDLWTYLMMFHRSGNTVYQNRANAWATYFKNGYSNCTGSSSRNYCFDKGFGLDHVYGWGLIARYEDSADAAALTEAENIAADIENLWAPDSSFSCLPSEACTSWGLRLPGRHLLFMTRLAEITGKSRWITLRDKIINLLINNPNWDATRGMYFVGGSQTDEKIGVGAYAAGARIQSTFHIGVLTEAFAHAYRTTGRQDIKNRMIAIAHFVDQYGLDPTYQYTASYFGVVNGKVWHSYSATQPVTFWDPVYTTDLVNTLVWGYKHTGDISFYNRAKYFFNRGTKGVYGSPTQRVAADNVVHHFVDTIFDSSMGNKYLAYNKGELQYTYLLFENPSASPSDTDPPAPPTNLTAK